jgi:penicillin-binding protein 1A
MIAIKLGLEVGLETVAQTAQRLGLRTEIERFPSTSIGAAEVIPLQMAEAYATFATLGTRVRPQPILRVLNREGEILWEPAPDRDQVMDSLSARIMVSLLEDVVARGTGYNVRDPGRGALTYAVPAAGKTGTTNDATNVWFQGFTPNLMATVWFGMDRPVTVWEGATGGGFAAPVWGKFMHRVYVGDSTQAYADSVFNARYLEPDSTATEGPVTEEEASDDVSAAGQARGFLLPVPDPWPILPGLISREVDNRSGLLASRWCPADSAYTELYLPGTEPTEFCDQTGFRIRRKPINPRPPPAR